MWVVSAVGDARYIRACYLYTRWCASLVAHLVPEGLGREAMELAMRALCGTGSQHAVLDMEMRLQEWRLDDTNERVFAKQAVTRALWTIDALANYYGEVAIAAGYARQCIERTLAADPSLENLLSGMFRSVFCGEGPNVEPLEEELHAYFA